ncbi:hypothetical protein K438DRAFT_1774255 [Mycena galopus ATCC 62051]|nr:hypothetical protein K438DRAFT_1774255 [Mycena galopus ATCC 62051]
MTGYVRHKKKRTKIESYLVSSPWLKREIGFGKGILPGAFTKIKCSDSPEPIAGRKHDQLRQIQETLTQDYNIEQIVLPPDPTKLGTTTIPRQACVTDPTFRDDSPLKAPKMILFRASRSAAKSGKSFRSFRLRIDPLVPESVDGAWARFAGDTDMGGEG